MVETHDTVGLIPEVENFCKPDLRSPEEARAYALKALAPRLDAEQIARRLNNAAYVGLFDSETDKDYWRKQIASLIQWRDSPTFAEGLYAQGIDSLLFDFVEWWAAMHAISSVSKEDVPFFQSFFFKKWWEGGLAVLTLSIGSLLTGDCRVNSLRNLWLKVFSFLKPVSGKGDAEIDAVNEILSSDRCSDKGSRVLLFRNQVIAHNQFSFRIDWKDVDDEIQLIARVWHLLNQFSETGSLFPFVSGDVAFRGLEPLLSPELLHQLQAKREAYIETFLSWTKTPINGESGT